MDVASRIEQMSRHLDYAVVASGDLIQHAIAESGAEAIHGFRDLGEHRTRGRETPIRLWGLTADSQVSWGGEGP